ncbi:MAG TPA: endo-1,4-beta-xylanase [Blastocatellia bacterium]|nr:endo-1,4-beta-xylanase [Blastocatellia bacterium]
MFHDARLLHSCKARRGDYAVRAGVIGVGLTLALAICFLSPLGRRTAHAQTGTVVLNDFEDGSLQGWIPRGPVTLTNTAEVPAHGGTRSLKTTGRTAGFHGPSLNTFGLLTKGATYQVTAWVRLVAGESPTQISVTMQRTVSGSNSFDNIASSSATGVTDAAWVQLSGLYAFGGSDPSALLLYIESSSATASYYVDDFSIVKIADPPGPPPNTNGLVSTFESGATEGWGPRIGDETVTVTSADAHSGANSLLTTGRTTAFRGVAVNVTNIMFNGSRYKVSLWAKLAPGQAPTQLRISLQRNAGTITTFHQVVGNTNVTSDAWVRLTTTYDVALANSSLILYVESATNQPLSSFYIDDVQITFVPPPTIEPDLPSVFQAYADSFPVGAAVTPLEITGVHADLLKKHFNSITSGNDFKWDATEPAEGTFRFTNADAQLSFAQANNIIVRGHTLLWHNQIPAWVFTDPVTGAAMQPSDANKALLTQRLQNHIRGVAGHFVGKLYAWDVVNEVIDENQPDCLRRSPWYNIIGPQYLDIAFQTAREVDPNAKLFINEFNSTFGAKRTCYFNVVRDLKARGVPVDGVGHQMHNNFEFPPVQGFTDTVNMFATLGVLQHVTEFDVNIYSGSANTSIANYDEIPFDRHVKVAYHYRDYFEAFKKLKDKIQSVTIWGLADDNTWLNSSGRINAPLLFDDQLKHKLAYTAVMNPLDLPGADLSTSVVADSNTVLSGHDVSYTITVTNNEHSDNALPADNVSLVDAIPAGTVFKSLSAPTGWSCTTPAVGGGGSVNCTVASLPAGASAQFNLIVTVACPTPNNAEIANSATVASTTPDPNTAPNNTASVNVLVSNPPPVISGLSVDKPVLWPPNHNMVPVRLSYNISDNCDAGLTPVITISSNEPVNGTGDGNTCPDWQVIDAHHVLLRAERSGNGSGRIYTITVTVTDSAGSSSSSSVIVRVPH